MKLDNYFLSARSRQSEHKLGCSKTVLTSGTDETSVLTEDLPEDDGCQEKNKREKDGLSFLGNMFMVDNSRGKSSTKTRRAKYKNEEIDSYAGYSRYNDIKPRKSKKAEQLVQYENSSQLYKDFSHDIVVEKSTRETSPRKKKTKTTSIRISKKKQDSDRGTTSAEQPPEAKEMIAHQNNKNLLPEEIFLPEITLDPLVEFTLQRLTDYPFDESQENKYQCDLFSEYQFKVLDINQFQNEDALLPHENFPDADFSPQSEIEIEEEIHFEDEIFDNDVISVCSRSSDSIRSCRYLQLQFTKYAAKNDIQKPDIISPAKTSPILRDCDCRDCKSLEKKINGFYHVRTVCGKCHDGHEKCHLQLMFTLV